MILHLYVEEIRKVIQRGNAFKNPTENIQILTYICHVTVTEENVGTVCLHR